MNIKQFLKVCSPPDGHITLT